MHFHKSFMYVLTCESFSDKCCPSTFFGIARIPQWLFTSQKRKKVMRTRGGRERASVSPRPSRLYPARTVRWAPRRFRPLESSSCTRPMPLGKLEGQAQRPLGSAASSSPSFSLCTSESLSGCFRTFGSPGDLAAREVRRLACQERGQEGYA